MIKVESDGSEDGFGPDHEKHKNYSFDSTEFIRLVNEAVAHVRKSWDSNHIGHDEL
jgi:hypothetical protein